MFWLHTGKGLAVCVSRHQLAALTALKDILLRQSLDVVFTLLHPAPELLHLPMLLLLLLIFVCEANVCLNHGGRVIELLKELTIPEINFSHFYPALRTKLEFRGETTFLPAHWSASCHVTPERVIVYFAHYSVFQVTIYPS